MRRTLRPGTSSQRRAGYVLVEAVALLLVVSIGVTAVVATVSRAYAAAQRQMVVTAATIQERNELARSHMAENLDANVIP